MRQTSVVPRVAILGLGNVLLGDDAFGPFTIEVFRSQYECGPEVEIVDLGTPGLDLAPYLYGKDLVIIVDAVSADGDPGTVRTYSESDFLDSAPQLRLTDHDPGLKEAIAQVRLVGRGPLEVIVIGVIPESCVFGKGISSTVLAAGSYAIDSIIRVLRKHGLGWQQRSNPEQPKLWWIVDGTPNCSAPTLPAPLRIS
jgi:hydrogenase maturation protease